MSNIKKTLINWITPKNRVYFEEFPLKKGSQADGLKSRHSSFNIGCIDYLYNASHIKSIDFIIHFRDINGLNLGKIIKQLIPYKIYNLKVQIHLDTSCLSKNETIPKFKELVN